MQRVTRIAIALSVFLLVLAGCQEATPDDTTAESDSNTEDIAITDVWVRAMESGNSAAYMTVQNNTDNDITLTAATTDVARMVQVHQTVIEDDVARMQEVTDGLTIPAGESVNLEPGGYHIMLMNLEEALVDGEETTLNLIFSNDETRTITAPIRTEAPQD
jgi:hypothetical protein